MKAMLACDPWAISFPRRIFESRLITMSPSRSHEPKVASRMEPWSRRRFPFRRGCTPADALRNETAAHFFHR